MKKKVNVFGKSVPVLAIFVLGLALASAALLPYFGRITGHAVVSQGLLVDGMSMPASGDIQDTYGMFTSLEAKSFIDPHYLDNNADVNAGVNLATTSSANETLNSTDEIATATQLQLTTGDSYVRNPSVVKDGSTWYMFYANDTNTAQNGYGCDKGTLNCDTDEYEIYVIKSIDNGKTWGTPVQVSTHIGSFNQRDVSAVLAGSTLYAFVSAGSGSNPIYYYTSTDGGATWNTPAISTGLSSGHFDATYDGTNFYITYLTGTTLEVSYSSDLSSWTTVSNALSNTHNSAVTKAMFDGSNLVVVWENGGNGIYYSTSSNPTTVGTWTTPKEIAKSDVTGYGDYDPVLYKDSSDKYWLFWAPWGNVGSYAPQWLEYKKADTIDDLADVDSYKFSYAYESNTNMWDFWPEATEDSNGNIVLFYTSESSGDSTTPTRVNGNIWEANFGNVERTIPPNTNLGLYTFRGFPKMTYPAKYTITTTVELSA